MRLQVLLVDDTPGDLEAYRRDFPTVFQAAGVPVDIHATSSFDEARTFTRDPSRRYDLIISDTFQGPPAQGVAPVLDLIRSYRAGRFCPIVVFSASAQPPDIGLGAFVMWADKAPGGAIEEAIAQMLATGIPQEARRLHDKIDSLAADYLWGFLERNWGRIQADHPTPEAVRRLIRRRAALQLAELEDAVNGDAAPVTEVHGLEYYVYPPVRPNHRLGEVLRSKVDANDFRVVLTPHCFLTLQPGQARPRAEYVRLAKTVALRTVLGDSVKIADAPEPKRHKKLRSWTTPPSGQDVGTPEGRYWYLPRFLEIPHLFCDFLQVDSVPYAQVGRDYDSIAVLAPPFAESLQACWNAFNGAVGIPGVQPSSIESILERP